MIEIILEASPEATSHESLISDPFTWLKSFSELSRFSLMVSFLDRNVRESILNFLSNQCENVPQEERDFVISKYSI